ncbi:hypothetical protein ASPZODRAFT_131013 [Penicilliopsis zonata CBS 506.65]|uniref:Uncharacterized protein n=1 Tax=Penicilliopsis zonata CBS 506.65 TaxID=1073090 RepID=A0A1L9SJX8_9EURO|nr:hypothetical protein ASPZODRAFT_131013 [Penicilliopsis zonata CBS 506.65]OJJ47508.1 hypothetical protein ASPZODRAFT_131013 [Penicilliopsis zonata CBS 506.65]
MDDWHRNTRMMHYLGEFLDLDPSKFHHIEEFVSLIEAIREGLIQIDEDLYIPDDQINLFFLSNLRSRAEWHDWATAMMRDKRVNRTGNISDTAKRMPFSELGKKAISYESSVQRKPAPRAVTFAPEPGTHQNITEGNPQAKVEMPTQDEINAFVVRRMDPNGGSSTKGDHQGSRHRKKPSQEEINDFVMQQMQQEQRKKEHKIPCKSLSQPDMRRATRCAYCGEPMHRSRLCWRRCRAAAEEV